MLSLTLFNSKNGRLKVKDEEIQIVLLLLGGVLMICFLLSCMSIKVVKDVQSFLSNFKGVEESGTFFPYQRRAITYNVSGLLIVSPFTSYRNQMLEVAKLYHLCSTPLWHNLFTSNTLSSHQMCC
uniref:Putative ovule protein n=1 Tax=Solanum chacoense TaxID=4108 RepID=A0A0V0HL40_SOLCH